MEKVTKLKVQQEKGISPVSELPVRLFSDIELERMGLGNARSRRNLRCLGKDPIPYIRIGKLVRYKLEDVISYIEANRIEPR
jgi:hypothetical protein